MIALQEITKIYDGHIVLENLTLNAEEGKILFVTGVSGIGKTTLLRILAGFEKPDHGTVILPEGTKIGMMFQEDRLFEFLSVRKNLEILYPEKDPADLEKELSEVLPKTELDKKVSSLSKGTKRRAALVRAMLHPGNVLLLDEPFSSLDEDNCRKVWDYIIRKQNSRTLIIASHWVPEEKTADIIRLEVKNRRDYDQK